MNKILSAVAAASFAIAAHTYTAASAQEREAPLREIDDYLFTPDKTDLDNCDFIVPLEFPQEEFDRRLGAGEILDDRFGLGHRYLYARNDNLPRVVINEPDRLIDIFLSTAAIEGQRMAVSRIERPDDTLMIDDSPLSEHLIQIDANRALVSVTNLVTGDNYTVATPGGLLMTPKKYHPDLAQQDGIIGPFSLHVESGYIEIATPLEFEGDVPDTSLRVFLHDDNIKVQYMDEIATNAAPLIMTLPNLPPWEDKPDIVCSRELETRAFSPGNLPITPRFD